MVRQWPYGTLALSRRPRAAQPRSGAMFVLAQVSSMKTEASGIKPALVFLPLLASTRHFGSELFGRSGDDLTLTVPVSFAEAALGTTLTVPTLDGSVSLKVPAGTSSGRTFRVRGRGVPVKSTTGDLLVTVEVAVPARLTPGAREAIEKLAAELPDDPRPEITEVLRSGGAR